MSFNVGQAFKTELSFNDFHTTVVKPMKPWLFKQIQKKIDNWVDKGDTLEKKFDLWSFWVDENREVNRTNLNNPTFDIAFDVWVVPQDGCLLGRVFTVNHDWFKKFMKSPDLIEYGYSDSTDWRPRGVSKAAYDARRDVWKEVFKDGNFVPANAGYTIDIISKVFVDIRPTALKGKYKPRPCP